MSGKVWLVTSGAYSDYGISGVFSSEKLARDYIDLHEAPNDYRIEEYPLDNPGEHLMVEIRNGLRAWHIHMDPKTGDGVGDNSPSVPWPEWIPSAQILPHYRAGSYFDCFDVWCLAYSEQEAIKIANEKRTQWLALSTI